MIRHPFMARALCELKPIPSPGLFASSGRLCSTDGSAYYFDPSELLAAYAGQSYSTEHACLHSVLHCLYLHPFFAQKRREQSLWDLACDICIWDILCCLEPEIKTDSIPVYRRQNQNNQTQTPEISLNMDMRQRQRNAVTSQLKSVMKSLTAQNIYRYLARGGSGLDICGFCTEALSDLFSVDDHSVWYKNEGTEEKRDVQYSAEDENSGSDEVRSEGTGQDDSGNRSISRDSFSVWSEIATQAEVELAIDMQNRSKNRGDQGGHILYSLHEIEREHLDYTSFLRKFAALEEKLEIDPDAFDYIFYTYGLSLYGNMPLIEPLEYKETHSIRDFVIAIDTSGSCDFALIRKFLTKTYDILSEKHIFNEIVNIHIMQCDAVLQEDVCLHNKKELENYIEHFTVKGQGGTDFRPVFDTVDSLRSQGELTHIRGLLYFTDGYGIFPSRPADYKTAFVFVQSENSVQVPPWAMKIMIEEEDL